MSQTIACEWWGDCEAAGCDNPEHNKRHAARAKAPGRAAPWSTLVLGEDAGGPRWFLDGRAINAGTSIEIQHQRCDYDDGGSFGVPLNQGTIGCFEVAWTREGAKKEGWADDAGGRVPMFHVSIGGHEFSRPIGPWHCFRWPR